MLDKENIEKTNAWPFVEAKKILRERKKNIDKKGKIILQTGYGPSGLPHIGTFGEVDRSPKRNYYLFGRHGWFKKNPR